MFKFVGKAFIVLLRFSKSLATKFTSLSNEPCLVRSTVIDLNSNKLHYYPFMISLCRCNGRFNTLDEQSGRICLPNETENGN